MTILTSNVDMVKTKLPAHVNMVRLHCVSVNLGSEKSARLAVISVKLINIGFRQKSLKFRKKYDDSVNMSMIQLNILFRRLGASIVDFTIEMGGGVLGCYFGAIVAAFVTAIKHEDPELMQGSIWTGLGYGFVFWSLSVSFVNRVLLQGVSRSSIGKKIFDLELISTGQDFTWNLVMKRWVFSVISLVFAGLGYAFIFFNREHKAFHDLILETDVVPMMKDNVFVSMSYQQTTDQSSHQNKVVPLYPLASRIIVLTSEVAERPMATVIRLPVTKVVTAVEKQDEAIDSKSGESEAA